MSSRQCPLCGKSIEEDDERFCFDCRKLHEQYESFTELSHSKLEQGDESFAQDATDNSTENVPFEETVSQSVSNSHHKKRNRILLIVFSVLIFLGVAIGSYLFIQFRNQQEMDELNFWNNSLKANTNEAYLEYMKRYPVGKYFVEAQNNILKFNENVKKLWSSIQKDATEGEVLTFISVYKDSPYYHEASILLDSLAWENVQKQNTQDAYKKYLDRAAKRELIGQYKALAEEKYDYLSQMEFVGGNELESVKGIISRYFRDLSSKSYADLTTLFSKTVKTFYKKENVDAQEIITSIQNQMKKDDIASVSILPDTETMKVQKDKVGNYIIELFVNENINYTKSKEKNLLNSHLFIVLDAKMKLIEVKQFAN